MTDEQIAAMVVKLTNWDASMCVASPKDTFSRMLRAAEAIQSLSARNAELEAENTRLRDALETIQNMHGTNPSDALADAPREDYLAFVLGEARKFARAALESKESK